MFQAYKKFYLGLILFGCVGVTVSCAPAAQPAQTTQPAEVLVLPTVTAEVTLAPTEAPTVAPAPAAQTDWTTTATVDGDYYVLGDPQAPIRLIDYSDFF